MSVFVIPDDAVLLLVDHQAGLFQTVAEIATSRMAHADITITSTNAVIAELQKTWKRADVLQFGGHYASTTPPYKSAIESFSAATAAIKE